MAERIIVNKLGIDHYEEERNNQDFCISLPNLKIVLDGCGSERFSEIGTRLFAQLFVEKAKAIGSEELVGKARAVESEELIGKSKIIGPEKFEENVKNTFEHLTRIFPSEEFYGPNLSFTILACFETEDEFIVYSCGDGFIITESEEQINFIELCDGDCPKYYIYNYVSKERLQLYKEGVTFTINHFSKSEFKNVGVATDGLRFYKDLSIVETNKLNQALKDGKAGKIKVLINRNRNLFKDDITICF